MTSKDKPKGGFVIKLSTETAQKLAEEDWQSRTITSGQQNVSEQGQKDSVSIPIDDKKTSSGEAKPAEISPIRDEKIHDEVEIKPNTETTSSEAKTDWGDYTPYITYEAEEAIYTDPSSGQKYVWDSTANNWAHKTNEPTREFSFEDDKHIYTEPDGSKFFWDDIKKAWIPKVDDDFLALYQMSYGFVDNVTKEKKKEDTTEDEPKKVEKKEQGVKRKNEPQWFEPDETSNTKVYVSNLPLDITEQEFVDFMQKCGLVMRDPSTQSMKVKMYTDKEHNCFKGDALCTYIKIESVELALKLLDGSDFKGNKIKVERAHFQLKGEYNPALKPKKKKKKELEKIKRMQEKLFDWRPEKILGERGKHEKVVIVKNLFQPSDFDKDVQLILDYQQDLREECTKCGEVRKVVIYDRHPEGVAQISMKEPEQADAVVALINGRWFGKRQITAEIWDGRTKYKIAETDADLNKRIEKWDKFLESEEKGGKKSVEESKDTVVDSENKVTAVISEEEKKDD